MTKGSENKKNNTPRAIADFLTKKIRPIKISTGANRKKRKTAVKQSRKSNSLQAVRDKGRRAAKKKATNRRNRKANRKLHRLERNS